MAKQRSFPSLYSLFNDIRNMKTDITNLKNKVAKLEKKEEENMVALDDLTLAVNTAVGAEDSAVVLINGIVAELQTALANQANTAAIEALVTKLSASTGPLAAAVAANPLPANTVPANTVSNQV